MSRDGYARIVVVNVDACAIIRVHESTVLDAAAELARLLRPGVRIQIDDDGRVLWEART